MTGHKGVDWHIKREIQVGSIINTVSLIVVAAIAVVGWWWDARDTDSEFAHRLDKATTKLENVVGELGDTSERASAAFELARANQQNVQSLTERMNRRDAYQSAQYQEIIGRLERIEDRLIDGKNRSDQ